MEEDQAFEDALTTQTQMNFSKKENRTTDIADENMPKTNEDSFKDQVVGSSKIRVLSDNPLQSSYEKLKEDIRKIVSGSLRQPLLLCPPKEEGLVEFFRKRGYEVADDTTNDEADGSNHDIKLRL